MIKSLIMDLSKESTELNNQAEEVLDNGELLDGTPVTEEKSSEIREMMDHAEKAREMSRQLNELADKADEILEEDRVHLVNEITTEAFQMNYRHIMEHAGLADGVVSFESSDKVTELNYLSNEARKMAAVADRLEDRILDFSPEGKIWSFMRADNKRLAIARGDIVNYGEKIIRSSKDTGISKIPVEWTLLGRAKEWLVFRDGKAVNDLIGEIIKDLEVSIKSFETIANNNKVIKQVIDDAKSGKDPDPTKLKQVKSPEIVGEYVLGDKYIKATSGELRGMFGWTSANPPLWSIPLFALLGPLAGPALVISQKVNAKNAMERSDTHVDPGKIKKMIDLFSEAGKIIDRDTHAKFDVNSIDRDAPSEYRSFLKKIAKQSAKNQGLVYEHVFFLTIATAETLRGMHGSWDILLSTANV